MEGSGNDFSHYYTPTLSPFGHPHGGAAVGSAFSSPSPASSTAGLGPSNPPLFPHPAVTAAGVRAPMPAMEPVRRKRGRPRKYGPPLSSSSGHFTSSAASPAVSASLLFSPLGFTAKPSSSTSLTLTSSSSPLQQASSSRRPQDASLGVAIQKFTPHFLTVAAGEDVAHRIMLFVQEQSRAVCIISASGTIADVTLRQPATAGGHMTYKGNFDILSLSGSFLAQRGGENSTGALSICLCEQGFIVGGGIGGPLVAASTVQVVAGSFLLDSDEALDVKLNTGLKAASAASLEWGGRTEEGGCEGLVHHVGQ